jgi:hypothetical protein
MNNKTSYISDLGDRNDYEPTPDKKTNINGMKLDFTLDKWQVEALEAEGNICICSGRQVGKSQIIAIKASEYMAHNAKKNVLIISVTEDQAEMMISKMILYLHDNYPKMIEKGLKRPTKGKIVLTNGSIVRSKAVGQYGLGILGMTVDVFIPDEAAYLPEAIWASATPMMLTTGGQTWLLSTPNAQEGYFYKAYTDPSMGFKTFHVNSEEVASQRPEPQRSIMIDYLKREKARMTDLQYAQQYLAQFLEEQSQLFPDSLISGCQDSERLPNINPNSDYYLGCDMARFGGDEITFEILEYNNGILYQRENEIHTKLYTTETTDKILALDREYNFKRIYIDDGGLGVAVFDNLLVEPQTKYKVEAINNASRAIDKDNRHKKLLKEDLYMNLKNLMEKGIIHLLNDTQIFTSLKSVILECNEVTKDVRIYGRYTHVAEGLIRAAWCIRNRGLNIYIC